MFIGTGRSNEKVPTHFKHGSCLENIFRLFLTKIASRAAALGAMLKIGS